MTKNQIIKLKILAREHLSKNRRFHDYGHALEVLENALVLQKHHGGNLDIIIPACLFHDLSNSSIKGIEGIESADLADVILKNKLKYDKDKIIKIKDVIKKVSDGGESTIEEIIVNDADCLAAFSMLSLARGFMIYGSKNFNVLTAINDFMNFLHNKFQSFKNKQSKHTELSRALANKKYETIMEVLNFMKKPYQNQID